MVCRSSRATSYRPFFIAVMALSKSSLSGCLDCTLDSGLALRSWFFFFLGAFSLARAETPARNRMERAAAAIFWENRFITTSLERQARGQSAQPKLRTRRLTYVTRLPGPLD